MSWARLGRQGMHTKFWQENILENAHLEDQEGDEKKSSRLSLVR
jgi:hypothetical protein